MPRVAYAFVHWARECKRPVLGSHDDAKMNCRISHSLEEARCSCEASMYLGEHVHQ